MATPQGTILQVDLSSRKAEKQPLQKDFLPRYVGGRGINARLVFDMVPPGTDALSPDNCLVFGSGALSGTSAPCPARFTVTAKSPLTGMMGHSNAGGYFGPAIKRSGIDHIVIQGKSDEPVYLFVDDGKAEIRPAGHLWGKDIRQAETLIKQELGDKRVRVAAIGQAGENQVRIANIIHEERAAARTGMGAVMGSKNLKAVAVRGSGTVPLHDPAGFNTLARELQQRIARSDAYDHFRKKGASTGTYNTDKVGFLAVRNFSQAGGFEGIENFNPVNVAREYYISNKPCFKCPIGCGKNFRIKEGPYAGEWGKKIEEGCFTPVGPVCGNADVDSVFKMNNMGNQLGVDLIEFGALMSVLMECYENGVVSEKDLDGIQMNWGNHEAMIQMLEKIAFRRGVGDILSDGIVRAGKKFGKDTEKYISHSKGMVMVGIDSRMLKGTSLGFATSTRGACHLSALVPVEFPAYPVMTPEQAEAAFGSAEVLDPLSYNKAAPLIYYQNKSVICDLFEICRFILGLGTGTKDFSYDDLLGLYRLATGTASSEEDLMTVGERVYNIERAFASREGFGRKDDHLFGKWADEPLPNGPYKGEVIDGEKWEPMLDEYYRLRGWDSNGTPTKKKLQGLGIEDVALSLERSGAYETTSAVQP